MTRRIDEWATPRGPRYRSLDVWRGLSALLVLIFHSTFYAVAARAPNACDLGALALRICQRFWIGVPFFFVISGYCISATVDNTRRHGLPIGDYFVRRLLRIFPPYWVVLVAAVFAALMFARIGDGTFWADGEYGIPKVDALSLSQWFGNATLTETWRSEIAGSPRLFLLAHAWTLCYEEQFYVVAGLLLLLWPRHYFTGALGISVIIVGLAFMRSRVHLPIDGFFFDGRWLLFAIGILVYYRTNYASRRVGHLVHAVLVAAAAYTLLRRPERVLTSHSTFEQEMLAAIGFALFISLTRQWDEQIHASALLRPLKFCGVMCYSLYLVHWPIVKTVSHWFARRGLVGAAMTFLVIVPLGMATSIGVSWLFHLGVERHFISSGARRVRDQAFGTTSSPAHVAAD